MKKLCIVLTLYLLPICAAATPSTVPNMTEWYHINSSFELTVGGPIGYLPNFDTANGGYHATIMNVKREGQNNSGEVWYHRYFRDTVKQFNWQWTGYNPTQVDFDGNGVLDYICYGLVIRGTKNGSPPEDEMTAKYIWAGGKRSYTVVDLNNDGKQDVLANMNDDGSGALFTALIGGSDLANLKQTVVWRRGPEYFIGLLNRRGTDGTYRLVTMRYDTYKIDVYVYKKWTSLLLNEMKTWMEGDSLHISLRTLDSISLNTIETGYEFGELQSAIYRAAPTTNEYLLISKYHTNNQVWTMAYDFTHDRFDSVAEVQTNNSNLHLLHGDINGDGYNDWVTRGLDEYMYFYAGQPEGIDTIPLGRYKLPCNNNRGTIVAIGDVNNDGFRDMAVALESSSEEYGCFAIILGRKSRQVTVGVDEPVAGYVPAGYDMGQNYPNPVHKDRTTTIPLIVDKPQQLTLELWTLTGRKIGILREGWTAQGTQEITVSLLQFNLPVGLYVLRLTGSEGVRERAILLD